MDVNLSKLMSQGQPTAEDLHKELLQSAWKDYVRLFNVGTESYFLLSWVINE